MSVPTGFKLTAGAGRTPFTIGEAPLAAPNIDPWSYFDHKAGMGFGGSPAFVQPTWVPARERRRLTAYLICCAYLHNNARAFLPTASGLKARKERREYGDPGNLVNTARAAMLGDDQAIVVDQLPGAATSDLDGDADDATNTATEAADDDRQARSAWLQAWADDELFWRKLRECESNAIGEGDGVYVLGWSQKHQRVRVRQFEPDAYFPVLTGDEDIDDYPGKVHLAWQSVDDDNVTWLRRLTYELVPLGPGHADVEPVVDDQGAVIAYQRRYPWQSDEKSPARVTCLMSDGTWKLDSVRGTVPDLADRAALWATNEDGVKVYKIDLKMDFLPIVHVPNTDAGAAHYGTSILALVAQILDDMAANDTDIDGVASTSAIPHEVYVGAVAGNGDGRPGTRESLPLGARKELPDTSHVLDALHAQGDRLHARLSSVSRVAEALLGKVDVGRLPSGVALALLFSPTQSLLRDMRGVRDYKYRLLLKMVQRLAIAGNVISAPVYPAGVAFGSYLPADKAAAVTNVSALLAVHAISTVTAVGMLIEAGFDIDDAQAEVKRINAERALDDAVKLLDATGDEPGVARFLASRGWGQFSTTTAPPGAAGLPPGGTGA